jgi:hypothetical protein
MEVGLKPVFDALNLTLEKALRLFGEFATRFGVRLYC